MASLLPSRPRPQSSGRCWCPKRIPVWAGSVTHKQILVSLGAELSHLPQFPQLTAPGRVPRVTSQSWTVWVRAMPLPNALGGEGALFWEGRDRHGLCRWVSGALGHQPWPFPRVPGKQELTPLSGWGRHLGGAGLTALGRSRQSS